MGVSKVVLALVFCLMTVTGPAAGQGRSGSAPGQNKQKKQSTIASPVTSTTATSAPATSANAVIYYGSWLDDASVVEPGDVWIGLSTGYWKADALRQIDAPVISAAVGLSRRMQVGGSLPFYHFQDGAGLSETGFGNMSLYGKLVLVDAAATESGVGLAVAPLVEIAPGGTGRLGWALPVNVEVRTATSRIYGSAGYFSRGSVFGTIAAQIPLGDRVSISGNFGQSYASAGSHQTALGVGAAFMVTPTSGLFVGLGQTFQPIELGPGGVSFAGGVSFLLPQPQKP